MKGFAEEEEIQQFLNRSLGEKKEDPTGLETDRKELNHI